MTRRERLEEDRRIERSIQASLPTGLAARSRALYRHASENERDYFWGGSGMLACTLGVPLMIFVADAIDEPHGPLDGVVWTVLVMHVIVVLAIRSTMPQVGRHICRFASGRPMKLRDVSDTAHALSFVTAWIAAVFVADSGNAFGEDFRLPAPAAVAMMPVFRALWDSFRRR